MDDGKCLLDVISDPQALKEFFRSPSQIGFVDDAPLIGEDSIKQSKDIVIETGIRSGTPNYGSSTQPTSIHSSQAGLSSSSSLSSQKTKPLAHYSYSTAPNLNLQPSTFTSHASSPVKNGPSGNIKSSSGQLPYITISNSTVNTLNSSLNQTNLNQQNVASSIQNLSSGLPVPVCKESVQTSKTTFVNMPISFAFGDASKARNLLSTGTQVVSSLEKPITTAPKPAVGQHRLTHPVQLKASPSKLIPNIVPVIGSPNRTTNVKGTTLPPLWPKKIIPRPVTQQNVATVVSGDQQKAQSSFQGNLLTKGVKGKVVGSPKGQPLIAIQPKLIITTQPSVVSSGLGNQATLGSNFAIGSKLQVPLQNQALVIQQAKPGVASGATGTQNKVSITNLVQLQPKQIAPKPDQSASFQVAGKPTITQDQSKLQQQLVQSLLAKSQQNQSQQFVQQSSTGAVLQENTQSNSSGKKQEGLLQQQNQLKELLQRNQLLQQVIQVQRLQQQQNSSSVSGIQVAATAGQNQVVLKPQSQTSPLQSLINTTLEQTQAKSQLPSVQTTNSMNTTPNLATQMKNAITAKQLQQFLEKNPLVAQQLKQMNVKQTNVTGSINTSTPTSQALKGVVQVQKAGQPQASLVSQVPATTPKKVIVGTPSAQPQTVVISQTQRTEQKLQGPQKVLLVQQTNGGTATTAVGQPRVLLQTKEGRPILLTQEQFKQIQQQLASKNLSIQAKLVTTANTPQVVVKPSDSPSSKATQKVVTTTPTTQVKQDTTKGVKRPVKPIETEEAKLIKRMKGAIHKDQTDVSFIDFHTPFKCHEDAVKKLVSFHVFSEPEPNSQMQQKANALLDKLALQLTNKSDRMINKYRQLLLGDMQRDVPSAELVMVNRIFLADEKAALMKEKTVVLEEAKNMAQSVGTRVTVKEENKSAHLDVNSTEGNSDSNVSKSKQPLDFLTNSMLALDEDVSSEMNSSEPQHIDIMDESPSPMASANSFLTHLSTNSKLSLSQRTSSCTPEPS